jgi:hypothetical protein
VSSRGLVREEELHEHEDTQGAGCNVCRATATHLNGQGSPITIGPHVLETDTKDATIYKPDGSLAQDTVEGAKLKKAQCTPQTQQMVCVSNTAKPGQSVKNEIDVGRLYKIDTPGTYHVKAELDISDGSTAN